MKTLKQAFNAGMEAFAKHCLMYGVIVGDTNYVDHTGKECRTYTIKVQGCFAEITKRTGEVIAVSYDEACYA
jgi:hypothetical protein